MPGRIILLTLTAVLYASAAQADLDSANNARARGDYAAAAAEYQRLAEAGDSVAQVNLGYMYYVGEGVTRDYGQAIGWYTEAANLGNADAQYNLAVAYAFGEGVQQDFAAALKWYQAAAAQGHAVAQYSLGLSYYNGEGVARSAETAVSWFARAAEQGYIPAQVLLGSKFHTGDGVTLNYESAVKWYQLAADQGDAMAQFNLAGMYRTGQGVQQDIDQARVWYQWAAEQGYSAAEIELSALENQTAPVQAVQAPAPAPVASAETDTAVDIPVQAVTETPPIETAPAEIAEPAELAPTYPAPAPAVAAASTNDLIQQQLSGLNRNAETRPVPTETPAQSTPLPESAPATTNNETGLMSIDDIRPALPDTTAASAIGALTGAAVATTTAADTAVPEESASSDIPEEPEQVVESENKGGFFSRMFGRSTTASTEQTPAINESAEPVVIPVGADPVAAAGFYDNGLNELKNKNFGIAVNMFQSAAAMGHAEAQYQLASLYQQGLGTTQSNEEAALWYRRAAEQGVVEAQYTLANMYLLGEGIQQDNAMARHWYQQAAAQGHAGAEHNLQNLTRLDPVPAPAPEATAVSSGNKVEEPAVQVMEAASSPEPVFPVTSEVETPAAPVETTAVVDDGAISNAAVDYERGLAYSFGKDFPRDLKTAFTYFKKAAENNYAPAQYKLGVAYAYGEGTSRDLSQSAYWYQKAATQGHPIAQRNLGMMYQTGEGTVQNRPLALAWFSILADRGNVMDIRRKETLDAELSDEEREQANQLKQSLLEGMRTGTP